MLEGKYMVYCTYAEMSPLSNFALVFQIATESAFLKESRAKDFSLLLIFHPFIIFHQEEFGDLLLPQSTTKLELDIPIYVPYRIESMRAYHQKGEHHSCNTDGWDAQVCASVLLLLVVG